MRSACHGRLLLPSRKYTFTFITVPFFFFLFINGGFVSLMKENM